MISCDVSVLDEELGARLEEGLTEDLAPVLAEALPSGVVRVRVLGFDEDRRDYEVEIETSANPGVARSLRCEACSERRLVEVVVAGVEQLLTDSAVESDPLVLAIGAAEASEVAEASPPDREFGGMGIAGAVLLGVGGTGIAAGTYLLVRGVERPVDVASAGVRSVDYRPWGAASLAAGVVIAGVGGALLGQDLRRRRLSRLAVTPTFSPTFVGLQFSRRF